MWILVVLALAATPEGKVSRSQPVMLQAPSREACAGLAADLEKAFAKESPLDAVVLQCVYLVKPVRS
jgi:hypothetical protein